MKTAAKVSIFFVLTLLGWVSQAQDPNYSQFFNNPVYYNPAYTGLNTGISARFSYRDLWPSLPYDFKAYHFDADWGDRGFPGSGGIGMFFNTDNEGLGFIRNLNLGVSLAVRIPFTANSVGQLGIKASWVQKSINWDDLVFTDEIDARYGINNPATFIRPENNVRNVPDFGFGGIVQFGDDRGGMTATLGASVDHLFEPDQSFLQTAKAPIPRKWVGHADAIFSVGPTSGINQVETGALKINPGFIYQVQGKRNSVQVGLNIAKYGLILGIWYKGDFGSNGNSCLPILAGYGMHLMDNMNLRIAYNYDLQMSGALQGTGGAHEVSLILQFGNNGLISGGRSSGGRMRGGHYEGQTPWECAEFW
ncbi:MAG TPA: PorP/SprF family type IX secretion system membrane protein [Bacteroidales bacterium]|nr:PorP/SprF family type IX secretion system membrane protein [Bacteroidales bacterium]